MLFFPTSSLRRRVLDGGQHLHPRYAVSFRLQIFLSLSLVSLSLSHSLTLSLARSRSLCCFVLLEPTWMLYRVPRVSPGVTAPILRSPRELRRAPLRVFLTDHYRVPLNVYYWRTWYKAVCGGKGGSEGHVLRDTTSRGLRGRV